MTSTTRFFDKTAARFAAAILGAAAMFGAASTIGAAAQNGAPAEADTAAQTERAAEARALSKAYGQRLRGALVEALKAGGPETAIAVCNTAAPALAAETSPSGWSVGRTSLKVRNPDNAPDAWERSVLLDFDERVAQGADPKTLEHAETTTKDGETVFRYMKAIPTGAPCLACHGSAVSASVQEKIAELYPDDEATGYAPGDLRGAFSLVQTLP